MKSKTARREQKIVQVIERCRAAMRAGVRFSDESVTNRFPNLMPELADALKKLRMAESAQAMAADPGPPPVVVTGNTSMNASHASETISPAERREPKNKYFGDYVLLGEIGRGGMGVVYKARQLSLDRIVAVKMILGGHLASDEEIKRFYAEAEAAAKLEHPHIVPIYEVGEHDGQPYFTMAYVEGQSLHDILQRQKSLPGHKAAEYVRKLADAMAYAHEQGVLHRDLKPANVLIDNKGEPRITDFGLAKLMGGDSSMTMTGQILGTPSFMPPEQAIGDRQNVGPLSDVYSLGAILYALVTGRPPHEGENTAATLLKVTTEEPQPPRKQDKKIHRDMEAICLKCLAKEPAKRFASAAELRDDLYRFMIHEPLHCRGSRARRAMHWGKRHWWQCGIAGCLFISLVLWKITVYIPSFEPGTYAEWEWMNTRDDITGYRTGTVTHIYIHDSKTIEFEGEQFELARFAEVLERITPTNVCVGASSLAMFRSERLAN